MVLAESDIDSISTPTAFRAGETICIPCLDEVFVLSRLATNRGSSTKLRFFGCFFGCFFVCFSSVIDGVGVVLD